MINKKYSILMMWIGITLFTSRCGNQTQSGTKMMQSNTVNQVIQQQMQDTEENEYVVITGVFETYREEGDDYLYCRIKDATLVTNQ